MRWSSATKASSKPRQATTTDERQIQGLKQQEEEEEEEGRRRAHERMEQYLIDAREAKG